MCDCGQRFRWQAIAGQLHALNNIDFPGRMFPGDTIRTLCGTVQTLSQIDLARQPSAADPPPTCPACHRLWSQLLQEHPVGLGVA